MIDRCEPGLDAAPVEVSLRYELDRGDVIQRALKPLSATPRPFLKWAGSKRRLLHNIVDILPKTFRTYREPFLGSGSLFFLLRPQRAVLSDSCGNLIQTYEALRDSISDVEKGLEPLLPTKEEFYRVRSQQSCDRFLRAAEFIYLNKTCWNGLYRVNSKGAFNVPFGRPSPNLNTDAINLRACAKALSLDTVTLSTSDFEAAVTGATKDDLVFLDPPYVTGHSNNGFVDYNETLFRWEDQRRLARVATELADQGVHVIVTNADHKEVRALYPDFMYKTFERASTLASGVQYRGTVKEGILYRTS
jgi:DNA adenine methylase